MTSEKNKISDEFCLSALGQSVIVNIDLYLITDLNFDAFFFFMMVTPQALVFTSSLSERRQVKRDGPEPIILDGDAPSSPEKSEQGEIPGNSCSKTPAFGPCNCCRYWRESKPPDSSQSEHSYPVVSQVSSFVFRKLKTRGRGQWIRLYQATGH